MALKILFFFGISVSQICLLAGGQSLDIKAVAVTNEFKEITATNQTSTNAELTTSITIGQENMDLTTLNPKYPAAEEGFITMRIYDTFKVVVWLGLVPSFAFLGLVGNVCGLWFLFTRRLQLPFYLFLFGLMAIDLLYLIIVLVADSIRMVEQYDKALADYINCYAHRNLVLIQSFTYSTCAHLIMMMSFERLISILFPLKIKYLDHRKYIVLLVIITFAVNAVLLIPGFLRSEPKEIKDAETNKIVCISVPTQWAKENVSFNRIYATTMLPVVRLIPGAATLLANILIAIFLARQRFQRLSLFAIKTTTKKDSYEQLKITVTLMALSIFLLLSLIPSAAAQIWRNYYPEECSKGGKYFYSYSFTLEFSNLLRVISAANDFFVYILTSRTSRTSFKELLKANCCICLQKCKTSNVSSQTNYAIETLE